jgi:hypothetical protein
MKKREFCNQEIETLLLRVKALAPISLKVRRENAKVLTPNLQNGPLFSHGGVVNFSRSNGRVFEGNPGCCDQP